MRPAALSPLREHRTTASAAPIIVNGSNGDILDMWRERIGDKPAPDFTDNFAVQLGRFVEPFLLDWIERTDRQEVSERQRFLIHPELDWLACTIDGYRAFDDAIIETKVLSPYRSPKEFCTFYMPQLLVQTLCRQCARGYLAVLQGTDRVTLYEMHVDPIYTAAVLDRLEQFQRCVDTLTPPSPLPDPPVPPEQWRTIDLGDLPMPNWGHAMTPQLRLWSDTKEPHDMHVRAKEDVKALLPDDVGEVIWHDITVKRDRRGAVSIRQEVE